MSGIRQPDRGGVIEDFVVHAANDAQVVRTGLQIGEGIADFQTAAPAAGKRLPTGHQFLLLHVGELQVQLVIGFGRCRSVEFRQFGFGVQNVDLAGPTVHEQVDDRFGVRNQVRRGDAGSASARPARTEESSFISDASAQQTEAATGLRQPLATCCS